ncbi:hypothetical protein AVEN_196980-1 [Araneus ventricosus]|uniref:RNA-directed DNA polymerase from mobile element jockey n=1 Tax=Araneus ventricosus TaxID=182803 RepID=A0A4Y2EB45_ARAVE|nr:hypothetical protein AVEN_196980-1 [Araneus ventricosus]
MNMSFIERQLQTAIKSIIAWADKNGFVFSSQKTTCTHFCKVRGLHPDPIMLLKDKAIQVVPVVKFLGILFDSKLTFRPHISHLKKKCIQSLDILKVLSNTTWGCKSSTLLKIYKSVVLSKLDYDSVIYGSAAKSVVQQLDTVHHQGLRLASGAFRTSPVQSLYVITGEPCLKLRRERFSLKYYFKIKQNPSHPSYERVMKPFFGQFYERRVSFIPSFGHRMRPLLENFNLKNIDILPKHDEPPPWRSRNVLTIDDFNKLLKSTTAPSVYIQEFCYHRRIFERYVTERVLAHGAVAWCLEPTVRIARKLSTIQRPFLLAISGAYRTTSTAALQIILGIPLLHLQLQREARGTALFRLRLPLSTNVSDIDPSEIDEKATGWSAHPSEHLSPTQISLDDGGNINTGLRIYTDGSKTEKGWVQPSVF